MKTSRLDLSELLDNDEVIAGVISDALESGDSNILLRTLGHVAKARGMSQISQDSGLGRESLYKALDENAHPRFDTVMRVLNALNIQMIAVPKKSVTKRKRKMPVAENGATYKV